MNKTIRIVLGAATAIVAVACQKKDDMPIKTTSNGETNMSPSADSADARGHSLVRIVNAVNGGKDALVQLDSVTIFEGVKAASVTDYREIPNNLAKFTVREPGSSDGMMVAQNDQILMDGNRYTVFLVAEDVSKNTLRIVKDEVIPDSGKARIRVVHAAPGAPELDIAIAGSKDKLFDGVNFKSEAGYKDVDPATVTLEVRAENEPKVLLRIPKVELKRGTATTIVITGANKLSSFKFTDAMMAPASKM
ncbi:MAG: DUF4397 domain-containing protein [Gemmatimonadaceae bacterium]